MTLAEIQGIFFLPENEQTPQKILGLNNITIIHGMLLNISIRPSLKLSKFELKENCLVHITTSPYAIHQLSTRFFLEELKIARKEKLFFTGLKIDTKLTSDYHLENLIMNASLCSGSKEFLIIRQLATKRIIHSQLSQTLTKSTKKLH